MTGYQPKTEKTCGTCGKGIVSPFCSTPVNVCKDWTPRKLVPPTGGSSGKHPPAMETLVTAIRSDISEILTRVDDLLKENGRHMERAHNAEARVAELERRLADADAATIAMEAKVVNLEQTITRAHAILDQAPGMESSGTLKGLADAVLRAHAELGGDAGPKRGG